LSRDDHALPYDPRTLLESVTGHHTLAQVRTLTEARAVAREVLRVYPVAPTTFFGVARRDLEIDGYAIRAGWKGAGAIWLPRSQLRVSVARRGNTSQNREPASGSL
jgi:hypothetical protein